MAEDFLEGQTAFEILKRGVYTGSIKQGYIFEGAEGIGKRTLARYFAKAALCSEKGAPCGKCHSCEIFEAGSHPDLYIEAASPVKVEAVRRLNGELFIKPIISERKVFIVENAGEMNSSAQNAFLKSFEEPPEYAVIILLTTDLNKLLPTIVSRGTRVMFYPFAEEKLAGFLMKKYDIDHKKAIFAARCGAGIIGRAESICEDEEFFEKRGKMISAITHLSSDKSSIFALSDAFGAKDRSLPDDYDIYFEVFISVFRDIFSLKAGGGMINSDFEDEIKGFGGALKASSARKIAEDVAAVRAGIDNRMTYSLWITDMLINVWEEIYGTGNRG